EDVTISGRVLGVRCLRLGPGSRREAGGAAPGLGEQRDQPCVGSSALLWRQDSMSPLLLAPRAALSRLLDRTLAPRPPLAAPCCHSRVANKDTLSLTKGIRSSGGAGPYASSRLACQPVWPARGATVWRRGGVDAAALPPRSRSRRALGGSRPRPIC